MLLDEPEKYRDEISAIKKDIAYKPIELKTKLEEDNIILVKDALIAFAIISNFLKISK